MLKRGLLLFCADGHGGGVICDRHLSKVARRRRAEEAVLHAVVEIDGFDDERLHTRAVHVSMAREDVHRVGHDKADEAEHRHGKGEHNTHRYVVWQPELDECLDEWPDTRAHAVKLRALATQHTDPPAALDWAFCEYFDGWLQQVAQCDGQDQRNEHRAQPEECVSDHSHGAEAKCQRPQSIFHFTLVSRECAEETHKGGRGFTV